jgi:hypothetical protein
MIALWWLGRGLTRESKRVGCFTGRPCPGEVPCNVLAERSRGCLNVDKMPIVLAESCRATTGAGGPARGSAAVVGSGPSWLRACAGEWQALRAEAAVCGWGVLLGVPWPPGGTVALTSVALRDSRGSTGLKCTYEPWPGWGTPGVGAGGWPIWQWNVWPEGVESSERLVRGVRNCHRQMSPW